MLKRKRVSGASGGEGAEPQEDTAVFVCQTCKKSTRLRTYIPLASGRGAGRGCFCDIQCAVDWINTQLTLGKMTDVQAASSKAVVRAATANTETVEQYTARTAGKKRSKAASEQPPPPVVVEQRGSGQQNVNTNAPAAPQPVVWKATIYKCGTRAGIHDIDTASTLESAFTRHELQTVLAMPARVQSNKITLYPELGVDPRSLLAVEGTRVVVEQMRDVFA